MKKGFQFFILFIFILFGCNMESENNDKKQENHDYYQFQRIDLVPYEIDAEIMIPDATAGIGASFKPQIIHQTADYKWLIQIGRNFELFIEDFGDNSFRYPEVRKKILSNKVFQVKIIKEEGQQMLFKRPLDDSYHIFAVKKIGGIYYQLSSREEGDTKKVAEFIYRSVKSFKKIK
jgi:hypothetical protein